MERKETFPVTIVLENLPGFVLFMTFTPSRKALGYFGVEQVCCSSNDSARRFDVVVGADAVNLN
ncbi:hypothetical protein D9M71_751990 [compost metagenome]